MLLSVLDVAHEDGGVEIALVDTECNSDARKREAQSVWSTRGSKRQCVHRATPACKFLSTVP